MRSSVLIFFLLLFSLESFSQAPVKAISIPSSNKGIIELNLIARDKGLIRSGLMLVQKK